MQNEDITDGQDVMPSDCHLFSSMKEGLRGNIMTVKKWKLQWWSGSKNGQQKFTRQGYMPSFERETLLL